MTQKKRLTNEIRNLICIKYNAFLSIKQISDELQINKKTVASVVKIFKDTGRSSSQIKNCGRKKKLTNEISDYIKNEIDNEVSITLKTLKLKVNQKFGVTLSATSISNAIENFNYSFKRINLVPAARNTSENKIKRFQYAYDFTQISSENLIFLDECGISCSLRKSYGRSLRGITPKKTIRAIRSRNVSISAAITRNALYYFEHSLNPYNGEKYEQFFLNLLEKLNNDNISNRCFVMDNVPFHKMTSLKEIILAHGHRVLFLPPYSPQLNPIENLFSKWKGLVKDANCDEMDQLLNVMRTSCSQITETDCQNYFSNMMMYIGKAFNYEDF